MVGNIFMALGGIEERVGVLGVGEGLRGWGIVGG